MGRFSKDTDRKTQTGCQNTTEFIDREIMRMVETLSIVSDFFVKILLGRTGRTVGMPIATFLACYQLRNLPNITDPNAVPYL